MAFVGMATAGLAVYIFPEENKWLSYIGFVVIAYFSLMTLYLTFLKKTI